MVGEGAITTGERARMVLGAWPRRKQELLAPFSDGQFQGLTIEQSDTAVLTDSAWSDYGRDRDREILATNASASPTRSRADANVGTKMVRKNSACFTLRSLIEQLIRHS
jgi:hypothetical protein